MKNKDQTLRHLQELLEEIPQVRDAGRGSPAFEQWRAECRSAVGRAFETDSDQFFAFVSINFLHATSRTGRPFEGPDDTDYQRAFEQGLVKAEAELKAMIKMVERYCQSDDAAKSAPHADASDASNRKVFIIHGHDEVAKHELKGFLRQLDLDPVILSEKPSEGKTIIEKFEQHAAVSYAVALLTPDDTVVAAGENAAKPRARQNVVFELGYFIGRLGRARVRALTKGKPEIPSDYAGVVYIPMDSGEWRIALASELTEAGFDIDMNKLKQ